MSVMFGCFIVLAVLAVLAFVMGCLIACGPPWASRTNMVAALLLLIAWVWLQHHPAVLVHAFPIWALNYLEGSVAVPMFMLLVGSAWAQSHLRRQKGLSIFAVALGVLYFIQGNMWMVQSSPSHVLGSTVPSDGVVLQSQDYSCVPAACATALNRLGVPSSEAELAELTHTRAGTGATLIRAMNGLTRRLKGTNLRVHLLQPTFEQLPRVPMPALTPLQFEPTRRHMVVVLEAHSARVVVVDPSRGLVLMSPREFKDAYIGQVLVFLRAHGVQQ